MSLTAEHSLARSEAEKGLDIAAYHGLIGNLWGNSSKSMASPAFSDSGSVADYADVLPSTLTCMMPSRPRVLGRAAVMHAISAIAQM